MATSSTRNCHETRKPSALSLLRRRGVLGDSLGAFRDGVLGELTGQDQAHAANRSDRMRKAKREKRTRSGSPETRWWTSWCMRQAWRPQWRRARRCLRRLENGPRSEKEKQTVDEGVQDGHG